VSGAPALDVRVARRVHAGLRLDVALTLDAECGVVFGPSGAGKTTLLRLIAGLDRPESGHVRLGDATLFDAGRGINLPLRHRRVGMVFQDDLLFPHRDVRGNIAFGLHREGRDAAARRVREVAALCGVEALLDRAPATLSGGERQRVGLARALAPRPRLLLCDEPVSALDLDARFALLERLAAVQRAEGLPVLFVTHSPAEAVAVGRRLFWLESGSAGDAGDPLEVLARRAPGAGWESVRNLLRARVIAHDPASGETLLALDGGPALRIPYDPGIICGSEQVLSIRADDILLARSEVAGLSARNVLPGVVARVVRHGTDAEVVVRTGGVSWIVSVVAAAVSALALAPGEPVHLVVKARGVHRLPAPGDG
jgi:molybdate transport system ATP-binding protein